MHDSVIQCPSRVKIMAYMHHKHHKTDQGQRKASILFNLKVFTDIAL